MCAGAPDERDHVVDDVARVAARLGKLPVVVGDKAGFIANTLLFGYLNHAATMYEAKYASREDIDAAIGVGRVVRALKLSSQPPKAGVMFPPDLARRLGEAATAALQPEDPADRRRSSGAGWRKGKRPGAGEPAPGRGRRLGDERLRRPERRRHLAP